MTAACNQDDRGEVGQFYLVEYDCDLDLFGGIGACGWFDSSRFRNDELALYEPVVGLLEGRLRSAANQFRCECRTIMKQTAAVHWVAESTTSGVAEVHVEEQPVGRVLLLCGVNKRPERESLRRFNRNAPPRGPWLRYENSGEPRSPRMLSIRQRPLAAAILDMDKNDTQTYWIAALTIKCLATAYFRVKFVA